MTFPTTPLDIRNELFIDGRWQNITSDVQQRSDIDIVWGKSGESSQTAPTQMTLTLNNRNGKYSPKNPNGALYGKIGRNTPIRTRIKYSDAVGNFVTNSTFETNVSGWQAYAFGYGGGSVAQSAVQAWQGTKSALVTWPTFSGTSFIGTVPVDLVDGRTYTLSFYAYVPAGNPDVRATLGFLTSSSYMTTKDAWTRITHTFVAGGLAFGVQHTVGVESASGTTAGQICYIDGVMVEEGSSASAFTTSSPLISTRATLEVSAWPPKWDTSGNDAYVTLEAAGRLARDSQSDQPVFSGLKDYYLSTTPIIYWPLSDGSASVKGRPAKGTWPYSSFYEIYTNRVVSSFGNGNLADYLPNTLRINDTNTTAGIGYMQGYCKGSDSLPDSLALEFVYRTDTEIASGTNMSLWNLDFGVLGTTAGTFDQWKLEFRPDGVNDDISLVLTLDTLGESPTVVNLANSAALSAITDGLMHHVRLQLTVNGADVNYTVYVDGTSVISGTRSTYTLRDALNITVYYDRLTGEDMLALGHLIVWENLANIPAIADSSTAAAGYAGEAAGRRFERLADVAGIPFESIGNLDDTMTMGLQYEDYYQNQILEIEATDGGMIYDPPGSLSNGYRTRTSLYAQTPAFTVDYSAHELTQPFEPVSDSSTIYNDVFAQRREGGSERATEEEGPLSIQEPPFNVTTGEGGVGRRKREFPVNTKRDEQLVGVSNWLLSIGTVDEDRYPKLVIDRANPAVVANPTLSTAILDAGMGDLISVVNADAAFIYDDPQLLAIGCRESLNWKKHTFEFVCIPASPYAVAKYGSGVATGPDRYDTAGSELTVAVNNNDTSFSVRSIDTQWTTAASEEFDVFIGGERVTVTAVTGGEPTFVGVGTSATDANAIPSNSLSGIGLPAGTASGDLVLIFASIRNSGTGTVNLPTNWTELAGTGTNARIFGRVYDGVWSMPTVTFTGGVANATLIGQSAAFRNVTMTDAASASLLNASAQNIDIPTTVVNTDGQWGVMIAAGWKQDDYTSVAALTAFTELDEESTTLGDDASQIWDYNITRMSAMTTADFVVTGGAAAISRSHALFLPRKPQTFTVTRSVNGVVKSHAVGTALRLWKTPKYALG